MHRRVIALMLTLIALLAVAAGTAHAEQVCKPDPLAGLPEGRWTIIKPCYSVTGMVNGYGDSSKGAYWLSIATNDAIAVGRGSIAVKIYPEYHLQVPEAFERVVLTGAWVTEVSSAGFFSANQVWSELVPVWRLERPQVERQYNEKHPNGSWWQVSLIQGEYFSHLIAPADYGRAGIPAGGDGG